MNKKVLIIIGVVCLGLVSVLWLGSKRESMRFDKAETQGSDNLSHKTATEDSASVEDGAQSLDGHSVTERNKNSVDEPISAENETKAPSANEGAAPAANSDTVPVVNDVTDHNSPGTTFERDDIIYGEEGVELPPASLEGEAEIEPIPNEDRQQTSENVPEPGGAEQMSGQVGDVQPLSGQEGSEQTLPGQEGNEQTLPGQEGSEQTLPEQEGSEHQPPEQEDSVQESTENHSAPGNEGIEMPRVPIQDLFN